MPRKRNRWGKATKLAQDFIDRCKAMKQREKEQEQKTKPKAR